MKAKKRTPGEVAARSLRFLIADDHPVVLSGLRKALQDRFRNAIFAFAATGEEAIEVNRAGSFDAILLEVATPDGNGLQTLAQLRLQSPRTPVLIVTGQASEKLALLAFAAGAAGFIGKSAPMPSLLRAVESVLSGEIYLTEKLTKQLRLRVRKSRRTPLHQILSPLELEVSAQLAAGRTARQIRRNLSHRARVAGRLRFTRAERAAA